MSLKLDTEPKITLFMTGSSALLALGAAFEFQVGTYLQPVIAASVPTALSCLASYAIYRFGSSRDFSPGHVGVLCFMATVFIFGVTAAMLSVFGFVGILGLVGLSLFGVAVGFVNLARMCSRMLDDKKAKECEVLLLEVQKINDRYVEAYGISIPNLEQNLNMIYNAPNIRNKKILIESLLDTIRPLV